VAADRRHLAAPGPAGIAPQPGFLPLVGYSQAEGFWIKLRIGFSPSDYYYGYYRVEEYTKIGLGLGYVATLRRKDGRRQTDINFYRIKNSVDGTQNINMALNDQENFSRNTRGQVSFNYTGDYGPLTSLPPQYTLNAAVDHADTRGDHQDYSFSRSSTGAQSSTDNYGVHRPSAALAAAAPTTLPSPTRPVPAAAITASPAARPTRCTSKTSSTTCRTRTTTT
jgi:hypothetical protein